jgi:hypothetical protein
MKKEFLFIQLAFETKTALECHIKNGNKFFDKKTYDAIYETLQNVLIVSLEEIPKEIDNIKNAFIAGQNCPKQLMDAQTWIESNYNYEKKY